MKEELNGLVSDDGAAFLVGKKLGLEQHELEQNIKKNIKKQKSDNKKMNDLDSFFKELDIKSEEFPDFLTIKNGIIFTLKLEDPDTKPRKYKDNYKNEKWSWNVVLCDIEPEEAKNEYIVNKTYSMSLGKRAMRRFKQFWLSVGNKYNEKFTFERVGHKFQTDYKFDLAE